LTLHSDTILAHHGTAKILIVVKTVVKRPFLHTKNPQKLNVSGGFFMAEEVGFEPTSYSQFH